MWVLLSAKNGVCPRRPTCSGILLQSYSQLPHWRLLWVWFLCFPWSMCPHHAHSEGGLLIILSVAAVAGILPPLTR